MRDPSISSTYTLTVRCGSGGPYIKVLTELCSSPINNTTHTHTHTVQTLPRNDTHSSSPHQDLLIWNIGAVVDWEPEAEGADSRDPELALISFPAFFLFVVVGIQHCFTLFLFFLWWECVVSVSKSLCTSLLCSVGKHTLTRVTENTRWMHFDHFEAIKSQNGPDFTSVHNQPLVEIE